MSVALLNDITTLAWARLLAGVLKSRHFKPVFAIWYPEDQASPLHTVLLCYLFVMRRMLNAVGLRRHISSLKVLKSKHYQATLGALHYRQVTRRCDDLASAYGRRQPTCSSS
jgi:hypothetical protein